MIQPGIWIVHIRIKRDPPVLLCDLSCCFDELSGLGQEEELTLENEEQKSWRIEEFIDSLKDYKDSVNYCHLTLDKLLQLVKLPPKDEKILVKSMLEKLGLESGSQQLYNFL